MIITLLPARNPGCWQHIVNPSSFETVNLRLQRDIGRVSITAKKPEEDTSKGIFPIIPC